MAFLQNNENWLVTMLLFQIVTKASWAKPLRPREKLNLTHRDLQQCILETMFPISTGQIDIYKIHIQNIYNILPSTKTL